MVTEKNQLRVSLLIETAKQLSLAELFQLVQALLEILQARFMKVSATNDEVTETLNQIYSTESSALDPVWVKLQQQALGDEAW